MLFTTPAAAEFSVWRGYFGCGHFISCKVCLIATISCAVMNIALSSASEAEDMTNLMIFASVSTGPFHRGMASFSGRKICAPALLSCTMLLLDELGKCPFVGKGSTGEYLVFIVVINLVELSSC